QEINKSKEETETEQKENEELVIKNKDLMYKFENFLNKNKELNENNKELNEKVIEFKKINEIMSQDLEIEKRQKSILEQKFHNYENNEITLNVQIQEGLRENENLKKEFDVEIDNHEKTIKIIELLKEENKILKDKIRGLNTHISKLSESVHQLLKNNDDKDKYYPALFESSQIKKNDEIKKINIDLDGKDLQIQMKNNLISDLEDEIKLLKNQLDEKENYTANAIEKIIEKKLT
ncbi:hypothetical protein HN836_03700, partial [Candidatus Woesearchaeota archaeon]|nr:hypothetical protein [Candidatus Woesearchaeota archaeon]